MKEQPEPTDKQCWAYLQRLALRKDGLVLHNGNYRSKAEAQARPGLNVSLLTVREWCAVQLKAEGAHRATSAS